jgi:glycosyltransferase involved in cell wall biosynthesis
LTSNGEPNTSTARTAVFTIVARNYLHYARVLMASVQAVHPDWERFVLLADRVDGAFDPAREIFHVVEASSLPIPDPERFFFRYTILELNTAVKPWFFRELFKQNFERVVYLDPDIFVYSPMSELERVLDGALAVLVPHLTGRIRDSARPGEYEILQAGAYNLGFCALARHRELEGLLDFWSEKSVREFASDVQRGLFTDQRWMDLVPGMFSDVAILRHEGYDVAYWNLPHRQVTQDGSRFLVNGVPLVFFHFSGIDPLKPEGFSKHQNRYRLGTLGAPATLVRSYCDRLKEADLLTCRQWPYVYGFLEDGSPLPDVVRRLYRTSAEVETWAGPNPFARTVAEWNESIDDRWPPLTRVMLAVYQARPDVRLTWPDVRGTDRESFVRWFLDTADLQQLAADCYVKPIAAELERNKERHPELARSSPSLDATPIRADLVGGALRKARIALVEGRLPLSPRRWLQLYRLHVAELKQAELLRVSPPLLPPEWASGNPAPTTSSSELTIVGYFSDATGVATGAHGSVAACKAVRIPYELIDARPSAATRGKFRTTLLHVNADQTPIVARALGDEFFRGRYTIGRWAWELEELPDQFLGAFEWLDEVWAMSVFVQQAIADKAPVPVVHMPLPVSVSPAHALSRRQFNIPDDRFVFLTMYDALSIQERKNPLGAIEAFRRAFPDRTKAALVVRVNHAASRLEDVAVVRQMIGETDGTMLLDQPMARDDAQALQALCDAFVSLHRSEGFGLNIAEAMLLGKPVVATGWSGNMDFTTPNNACLVDYQLVPLARDHGPYQAGSRWAEPDVDQAAASMRRLVEDRDFRREIASRGQQTIATDFSPSAIGSRYRSRLAAIEAARRTPNR